MSKKTDKEKNQHIQVFVRCRPLNTKERKQGAFAVVEVNDREVHVKERAHVSAPTKIFNFDRVYGPYAKQIDIYKQTVHPLVDEVLSGYNCTLFAYGQTGTGKTYTMEGERSPDSGVSWEDDPLAGVIPRAMNQLFCRLTLMRCEFSVRVSYLEIYNEELIDLLGAESVENPRLRIYEDSARKGSCIIQGLEEVVVADKDEVYRILEKGSVRRQTAATQMNAHSSRSHSLFMVTVHIKENSVDGEEMLKTGKLNLVDLAGSECIGRSGAQDKRAREAGNINQSLLTLGRVITALLEHAPHVPYRESKLTRLLQDSLGGRTKTSIIATVSPNSQSLDETLSTLDYAFRAKNITNRPEINQRLSKKTLLKEYNEEIERLRRDLQAARDKNGIYLAHENYEEMQLKLQQQRDAIVDYTERITVITTEMMKLSELFADTKGELENTEAELCETRGVLKNTEGELSKTRLNYQLKAQDCEEQRYLVSRHSNTEAILTQEANQILFAANEATSDISSLHQKLNRQHEVEVHNEATFEHFNVSFHENIAAMKEDVRSFSDAQINSTSSTNEALGRMLERRTNEVNGLCSHLDNMVSVLKERIQELEEKEEKQLSSSEEWAAEVRTSCLRNKEAEVTRQTHFHNHTFLATMVDMQAALRAHTSSLQLFATDSQAQMEAQQTKFSSFVTELERRLRLQDNLSQNMTSAIKESLVEQKEQVHNALQAQTDLDNDLGDNFIKTMVDMLADMKTSRKTKLSTNMGHVLDLGTTVHNEVEHFGTQAASGFEEALAFTHGGHGDFTSLTTTQSMQRREAVTKRCEEVNTIIDHQNKLQSSTSTFAQETSELCAANTNKLLDKLDQHTANLLIGRSIHKKGIHGATGDTEASVEVIKVQQNNQEAGFKREIGTHRSHMESFVKRAGDWSRNMRGALEDREDQVDHLFTEDRHKDLPTGSTPKPRNFNYPHSFSHTDRHSMLVQDFRRNYTREGVELPLPLDSSLRMSDVIPFDIDADCEAPSDVQNASADSAFSISSYQSSTTTSDQHEVENMIPAHAPIRNNKSDDEQKLLKPPKIRVVAKSQQSRSRSRTGTRDASTGSKPGTPRICKSAVKPSPRESRTRVPLRTANSTN